jgi:hypothetical protein
MSTPAPQHEFDADLEMDASDNGVFLVVPFNVQELYGTTAALPVRGTIDGFPIRLSLLPLGNGEHMLPVRKEIRNAIGKSWSSTVHVIIERDTEERPVEVPAELRDALEYAGLQAKFDELPYGRRKELAGWVGRAKKGDTRDERAQEAVQRIKTGAK